MKHTIRIAPERRKDKQKQLIIDNVPLFADIRFAGTRIFYYTGYRVKADNFSIEAQAMNKNSSGKEGAKKVSYNVINKRLTAIASKLNDYFEHAQKPRKSDIKAVLDEVCKKLKDDTAPQDTGFFSMFDLFSKVDRYSPGRKRHIISTANHWKRFEKAKNLQLSFDSITVETLRDFERYLKGLPVGVNRRTSLMKLTKSFWVYASDELKRQKITIKNPFGKDGYKPEGEVYQNDVIYITGKERDLLFNAKLENTRIKHVRDIFVFQCLVGARVGDLCKFTKSNITTTESGAMILSYIPRKTKEGKPVVAKVPLHTKAIEILNRYDLPDGRLLPFISDQRYNDYLKELFQAVGLIRLVTRRNPTTGESEQVRLCDIASSHVARRSFIGNLYGKAEVGTISSMSGHAKNSRAFSRYYNVDEDLQIAAINQL